MKTICLIAIKNFSNVVTENHHLLKACCTYKPNMKEMKNLRKTLKVLNLSGSNLDAWGRKKVHTPEIAAMVMQYERVVRTGACAKALLPKASNALAVRRLS
jgi:hypothetical protein